MKRGICLFFFVSILCGGVALAQKTARGNAGTVELTQTDIARLDDFDGKHATVFGIGLGMNMRDVKSAVEKQKHLRLERDATSTRRLYLYDVSRKDTTKVLLGYLKWLPEDSALNQIVLYESISPYLKGLSCSILSKACMDPESDVYKRFLGKPADQDVVIDIPSIGLRTVRYYYPSLSLMIEEEKNGGDARYRLILYGFKG